MQEPIAITSVGLNTYKGQGVQSLQKREDFPEIQSLDTQGAVLKHAGEIKNIWSLPVPQKKLKKFVGRKDFLAVATAKQTLDPVKQALEKVDPYRRGVFVGSCSSQLEDFRPYFEDVLQCVDFDSMTFDSSRFGSEALSDVNPISAVKVLMNGSLAHIAQLFEFRGPNSNFMDFELSGFSAVKYGINSLLKNECDICLVGAVTSPIDPFQLGDPEMQPELLRGEVNKNFTVADRKCKGRVLSEASAFVVLERLSDARKNGSNIIGIIHDIQQTSLGQSIKPVNFDAIQSVYKQVKSCIINFNGGPKFDRMLADSIAKIESPAEEFVYPLQFTGDLSEVNFLYQIIYGLYRDLLLEYRPENPMIAKNDVLHLAKEFLTLTVNRFGAAASATVERTL